MHSNRISVMLPNRIEIIISELHIFEVLWEHFALRIVRMAFDLGNLSLHSLMKIFIELNKLSIWSRLKHCGNDREEQVCLSFFTFL